MQAKIDKEVKDMTVVQETDLTQEKMTTKMKMLKKGQKFRLEHKMQMPQEGEMPEGMGMAEMEFVIIYDGKDVWHISPFMGKRKLPKEEAKQYREENEWWDWLKEGAVVGSERASGRDCYVVDVQEGEDVPFTRLWLDKKSFNIVKGEMKTPTGEKMLMINSDFKKIKGDLEMSHKTEVYMEGTLISTTVMKSLEINKGLSDDLFDPDKVEVKGFDMQEMMRGMMEEE
jgi:outer membrane lipoprotein-sorting protein